MNRRFTFFNVVTYLFITLITIMCVIPMVLVIMVSFSSEESIIANGYQLIPETFSIEAYRIMFKHGKALMTSYGVSIFVTCVGVVLSIIVTASAAYALGNRRVAIRNKLAMFFFFTTMFNGGMVPWYIICSNLGLRDNVWALIVPNLLFNCFNMFLIRNYIMGISVSLMESALIDGAGDFTIAFRIYFPICKPVLAAVSLFIAIGYWNDWWNAIMLIDDRKLYPLQFFLFNIQSQIQMMRDLERTGALANVQLPNESFKMATVIVTIGPIILLYPFLQRYFVKGIMIGAIKG